MNPEDLPFKTPHQISDRIVVVLFSKEWLNSAGQVNRSDPPALKGNRSILEACSPGEQMEKTIQVRAFWDVEAKVWVAESDDVPGLVTEAESVDRLIEKLKILIPELLAENGIARAGDIPFRLVSEIEVVSHQRAA